MNSIQSYILNETIKQFIGKITAIVRLTGQQLNYLCNEIHYKSLYYVINGTNYRKGTLKFDANMLNQKLYS